MKVIAIPATLDERSFDGIVQELEPAGGARALIDARRVHWVDPYGLVGLLALGAVAGGRGGTPVLELPESLEVLSYLGRMDFFEQAAGIYELHGTTRRSRGGDTTSDVLLEVTGVRSYADVHAVVDRVNDRALAILTRQLNYPMNEAFQFSAILSEVCQNILDHAGADGWVATQTYSKTRQLDARVVRIAVMDIGVGFKESLASTHATRFGDRWNDATALEAGFIHGLTRFPDPGRGQGLQQIRRNVARWNGRLTIRSGTARIAGVPDWDPHTSPLEENLQWFPGAQICIDLPERAAAVSHAGDAHGRGQRRSTAR